MSKLEYLDPKTWKLHIINGESDAVKEDWIKVPEGAEVCTSKGGFNCIFWKEKYKSLAHEIDLDWRDSLEYPNDFFNLDEYLGRFDNVTVVWRREPKEYLVKAQGGNWVYTTELSGDPADEVVEIPSGAEKLTSCNNILIFWKEGFSLDIEDDKDWVSFGETMPLDQYLETYKDYGVDILWQRTPQRIEELREVEEVRQDGIGSGLEEYIQDVDGLIERMVKDQYPYAAYLLGSVIEKLHQYSLDGELCHLEGASQHLGKLIDNVEDNQDAI